MFRSLPNLLTLARILIIPLIIIFMYFKGAWAHQIATALFLIACLTDFLDGYLARMWSVQSSVGKFMDPIADKILVASVILVLVGKDSAHIIPSLAILCREILVSGLREFLAEVRVSVPVSKLGKIKTGVQMTALSLLILGAEGSGFTYTAVLGKMILWLAAGLTLFTGYAYLKASWHHLISEDKE